MLHVHSAQTPQALSAPHLTFSGDSDDFHGLLGVGANVTPSCAHQLNASASKRHGSPGHAKPARHRRVFVADTHWVASILLDGTCRPLNSNVLRALQRTGYRHRCGRDRIVALACGQLPGLACAPGFQTLPPPCVCLP